MLLSQRKRKNQNKAIVTIMENKDVPMEIRLKTLEEYLKTFPPVEIPLNESFGHNLYVREIIIPAGTVAIGHIHKYEHLSIMVKGELIMWTEMDGIVHLKGYNRVIAPAGIKRAGFILEDVHWITAHGMSPDMDPEDMVPSLTVSSYAEYAIFKDKAMAVLPRNDTSTLPKLAQAETGLQVCP